MVRLGASKAAVGSAALQCHSLSRTLQGCSVPMMFAAAADARTAFATCTEPHVRTRTEEARQAELTSWVLTFVKGPMSEAYDSHIVSFAEMASSLRWTSHVHMWSCLGC